MVEKDKYRPHQSKGAETEHGGAAEVEQVADEVTGELLLLRDAEKIVLEGEGVAGKRPRRTIYTSPANKAQLLEFTGKTETEDGIVPERFLDAFRRNLAAKTEEN